MWWLDPGKEVLNVLFNRILAPYVMNLDLNQVNYGIGQGQLTLRNLKLKKGALDKFQLPVDVLEGHLGKFTLSLHWMNLGNQPVEVLVEDVYLLVVPSPQTSSNPEEDEARAQAAKAERLESAELLHVRGQAEEQADSTQSQGLIQSLIAKVINNVQVTVKNIHIRYEDSMSVPGHPFAAGVTLAGFTAVSVNNEWKPAFIESTAGAIHKLASLQSLALYFDTDSPSMAGLPTMESIKKFSSMISHGDNDHDHQYILKPVSGEGRVIVNHKIDSETPRFDIQLFFEEIGVVLDDNQYRDAISLVDMYHVYLRKRQYGKYRPPEAEFSSNPAKARIKYAATAILEGVREKNRKWTWQYFAERRDDRNAYVELFQKKLLSSVLPPTDLQRLGALEKKMSYEDIRFYRSIARSRLKKDTALRKGLEAEKKQQQQKQSWGSWLWGTSANTTNQEDPAFTGQMTDEQRKQLYDVLDFDEKAALVDSLQTPRDSLKMRVAAKLNKGSFALRTDPHGKNSEVMSVVFDIFGANFIQRPDNFEASISLNGLRVFDGTTPNSLYPQIVHVKTELASDGSLISSKDEVESDPFFFVKFENNPLDERSDSALTVRMRHMEIIYHKGYVEAVYKFFKPPASQLESVEALLSAASQTLEGLRRDTRAGLEYALQTHKTIDVQMDLNAPVIIVPEDVSTNDCKHLIVDAGHIAIESNLASKEAIKLIHQKRNQQYTDDDYKKLESLMYDKLSLRLEDAQFVIGDNLQACRNALIPGADDSLHILERINIDLRIDKSIVPTAVNIAQFKVSGKLPSLQVNISDTKYKSLMRLIDVCIPHFETEVQLPPQPAVQAQTPSFQLPAMLFGQSDQEYNVDDDDDDEQQEGADPKSPHDVFFEAEDGTVDRPEYHQHIFEVDFKVDNLRAVISKTNTDGTDKYLGDLTLQHFSLAFALAKFDMKVDINLSSVAMNVVQPSGTDIQFISTPAPDVGSLSEKRLLQVSYMRVQRDSPDFQTIAEGIDQSVDIKISTLVFQAAPEPVLTLYDFIMTTFVPASEQTPQSGDALQFTTASNIAAPESADTEGKIRVIMKLAGVRLILVNDLIPLATLALSTADVTVLVRPKTLRVSGRLGNLSLMNDNKNYAILGDFNRLVSIEGENFADFSYQTFDPEEEGYAGVKSSVHLHAASIKLHFVEQPLHDLYLFLSKLAKLKGLYDAATQVAVQRASEIERMQFEVSVKTPIVVFPSNATSSQDALILRLGQIDAHNTSEAAVNRITAGLHGIRLVSCLYREGNAQTLKIIDDIDVSADVVQTSNINRNQDVDYPDTQVVVKISDVKLHLTQVQYCLLMRLATEIPRVFAGAPEIENPTPDASSTQDRPVTPISTDVRLEPELRSTSQRNWTTLDVVVSVNAVKLHLYDGNAFTESQLKEHGIARFALNDNTLRFKLLSDGAGEAQVVLRSFTMSNTRPGTNRFREIIPAAQHNRNQFMLLYSMTGGQGSSSLAVLTVDSPQIIFAVDPVISLLEFFTSALDQESSTSDLPPEFIQSPNEPPDAPKNEGSLEFRLDLHDVSISVLENDADPESRAIRLYIGQILLAQQGIMALTVNRLGMSLMKMGRSTESVRFLDDVDLTFSLDSRTSSLQQITNIELVCKPIVFRASYRDINLITSIVNKAIERYGESQRSITNIREESTKSPEPVRPTNRMPRPSASSLARTSGKARVSMSKEIFKGSFDGFRLILIGDLHEQPMLHLKLKPFIVGAQDWTGQLHATTTISSAITYWNLTNSHWEPLIDPWTLTIAIAKESPSGGLDLNLSARERLDLNISTTFVELALTTFNAWNKEGDAVLKKARGAYAPYRIRNQTGSPVFVWSDTDSTANTKDVDAVKILHDQAIDWRFDDWKTMREHASAGQHNIGIQFSEKTWEQLRGIPVDREGEFVYSLRPRTEQYPSRLLCEVTVVDNTKIVTIRSTYKIENLTLYPLEVMLVDDSGHPVYSLEKVVPGQDFSLPIEAVTKNRVRIQPDQGFGYRWSFPIRWEDLISRKSFTIKCPHSDPKEAAFRLQAWVQTGSPETSLSKYPKINLRLRAPLELENLLPYNLEYRIYDKNTNQNWKSYLRRGGVMPVHSVELGHFILLNVNVQDTVFKPSEFTIINTDGHSDFEIENTLTLRDQFDRKLDLSLNYVRYPDSGGAFKVQIYSPYIVVNKTGLPLFVKSTRSTRAGSQDVAGDTRPGKSSHVTERRTIR
ncbi:hypothetical protein D9613_001806 [Agrocybe pediades]|uniref:Vacuolar protein sorting-associated protein n=1 Tax=Agrocybe pediades TaxID=84607 RepID=A0A8H4R847_9AGAR|nr:hypothetical protein D9613_001806 [Agrocybe pediades]